MEGIIKFTPLLFSVALAYTYIILGTSKITNAQTLSTTEVANTSTEENSTRAFNVTNSINESIAVLDIDVPVTTSRENRTERLDTDLSDDNSTQPHNATEFRNGTSIFVNSTTGDGTSENHNVTTWSTNQNNTIVSTPKAASDVFVNDTTLIVDVPGTSDSGNATNVTSSGNNTSLLQNTTLPPNSTDGTTFTGFYTYKPIDANNSEVELLENQTRSVSVTLLSSNISQDDQQSQNRTPKMESQTAFPTSVSNQTSPSIAITSYTDAFNNGSSNVTESENQTLESNVLIIPLNGSEFIPTMGPSTTLQIDSSLNVTETTTTMSTTLQAGSSLDGTTSKRTAESAETRPDATKGRSWSSTLKNKLTTPILPANTTKGTTPQTAPSNITSRTEHYIVGESENSTKIPILPDNTTKGTSPRTGPSNMTSRTEHYIVGESENSTTVPTTMVTLLFIPYVYGNESTNVTKYTTPTATTTSPSMLPSTSSPESTTEWKILLTSTSRPKSTTEWKMFTTTEKPTTATDFSTQSEVDKVKEKTFKKKAFEELLPEEKENIVTIVFNKLTGNLTENFEDVFSYFVSRIMNNYLKMWTTMKEPDNELSFGPEQVEVTEQNIHFLKPTPYFSKDSVVITVTFYVTSTSPSGTLTVFPAEVVMQNLKDVQNEIQKELKLNATDIFIGVHPNFNSVKPLEDRQLFSHFEPLFIALIAVAATCLFTLLTAIICFKCRQKGVEYSADREKLNQERTYSLRGQDLRPECEILREERQMAEKDGGMMNGEKKHPVRQNGEEGWVVPIGEMPLEEQNAPAIQDTRL